MREAPLHYELSCHTPRFTPCPPCVPHAGSYSALFAKLLISGFFFVVLVKNTPFNSQKLDLLVSTGQFCSLATLFFMLMMKIGFFAQEGVDEGAMNAILMFIMFFPLFVALYIISSAIHEATAAHFRQILWPRCKAHFRQILWPRCKIIGGKVLTKLDSGVDSLTKHA